MYSFTTVCIVEIKTFSGVKTNKKDVSNWEGIKNIPLIFTLFIPPTMSHTQSLHWFWLHFRQNLIKWCFSPLCSAIQIDAAWHESKLHLQLKTRWHICSWLAQTGRNDMFAVAGLLFRASFSRQADFWQCAWGKSHPRISTNPWAEWEGAVRWWHGVDGGLSCDPDFCTSLCPRGHRRSSSFILLRAELLAVLNTVTEGEWEKETWASRKREKVTLSFDVLSCERSYIIDYFGDTCKWVAHQILVYTVFVYLSL